MNDARLYRFDELSMPQRQALHAFIAGFGNPTAPSSPDDLCRTYGGAPFTQGSTHWSLWVEGMPVAALGAVTEARAAKGEVYLTHIYAGSGHFQRLDTLLQTALGALGPWLPCRVKLGAHAFVPGLPAWAEAKGFQPEYRLVEMVRRAGSPPPPPSITWRCVTEREAEAFRQVSNAAFLPSPNGRVMDAAGMRETLEEHASHPHWLQLGEVDGRPAVALSLDLKPGPEGLDGIIDGLGVHPAFQGRGLGREGLHRGIHLLGQEGAARITLTVIDSNGPAVALYRSEGFEVSRELSTSCFRDLQEGDADGR